MEILIYQTEAEEMPFALWLDALKDIRAKAAVRARLARLQAGNFGDSKALRDGVSELRIQYGQGFRVYFSRQGPVIVLLLVGGEKSSQDKDIDRAIAFLEDWKSRPDV